MPLHVDLVMAARLGSQRCLSAEVIAKNHYYPEKPAPAGGGSYGIFSPGVTIT